MNYIVKDQDLVLEYHPGQGAWTYRLVIPNSRDIPGTWKHIKVSGTLDDYVLTRRNLAPRRGLDKLLSINADIRRHTGKQAGDTLSVYPESDSTVLVCVDISNGPPAFHLGSLYRRAVVRRGVGHCAFQDGDEPLHCRLRLTFSPQAVVVATEAGHGDCGFGQGVSADETYRRTTAAVPQYFTDSSGDKTFFKRTTPEQYNQD